VEEIVTSLQSYRLTKELKALLRHLQSAGGSSDNMAEHLLLLYQEDLLGRSEYLALRASIVMKQYFNKLRNISPELRCAIYLYDTQQKKIWNASTMGYTDELNEYTQGLDVEADIRPQAAEPVYTQHHLIIENVSTSEHPVVLNHRQAYLRAGIHSFITMPLRHKERAVGHQLIAMGGHHLFTEQEIEMFSAYSRMLEMELASVNKYMIHQIQANSLG
jgi:hypothetical protein